MHWEIRRCYKKKHPLRLRSSFDSNPDLAGSSFESRAYVNASRRKRCAKHAARVTWRVMDDIIYRERDIDRERERKREKEREREIWYVISPRMILWCAAAVCDGRCVWNMLHDTMRMVCCRQRGTLDAWCVIRGLVFMVCDMQVGHMILSFCHL